MTLTEKIKNSVALSREELEAIVYEDIDQDEDIEVIDIQEYDEYPTTREMATIIQTGKELYCIEWVRGLVNNRYDEFKHQPYKVIKRMKIVEVPEYITV